jgi:hypothetical protein
MTSAAAYTYTLLATIGLTQALAAVLWIVAVLHVLLTPRPR